MFHTSYSSLRNSAVAALVLLLPACTSTPAEQPPAPTDARVDAVFAQYTAEGSPGATAMVIKDGEVVHSAGYGLADLVPATPLTPDMPLRLGSVSKQFFAMAIMILAERDSLDYDDPAVKWIPEMSRFPGITLRHMLNHTSGLPDYYDEVAKRNPQLDDDPLITNSEAVTVFESWGELDFQPGDKYQYSNPAYEMLALIVERISRQSSRQFIGENIFTPLGMTTADIRDRRDFKIPNSAVGYRMDEDSTAWVEDDDNELNGLVGAGGVYASVVDMYRWDQSLYSGGVVSWETLSEAFEPATLNDGSVSEYGFGWGTGERNGHKDISHGGSWVGFRTSIDRYVDQRMSIIVLTNSSGRVGQLRDQVAELFLVQAECDAECMTERVVLYFSALDQISRQGSTIEYVDGLLAQMHETARYIHLTYEADFTRETWREAFARNLARGAYTNGPENEARILYSIPGLDHLAVEYAHGTVGDDGVWSEGERKLVLFQFKDGKISRIEELW
ncbi:MAG: CubicO group peptidase (beta-lactamase class C family) [Rhodothermales bacterium]|jgi:CubicO group peptidase (beta-lactamase class C family)